MYKVVDLFAGAGGLSLGFMQTRKYDIKVAFENSPYMQETYRLNHPGVEVQGDVCAANYDEIQQKSTHNRRERPVYGHRGGSRGRFYYRITTFEERPWDARDPH